MTNNIDHNHQAPSGEYNRVDYAEKMEDLLFNYDKDFYPNDEDLPDPQIDPIIPGARVALDKVGIGPVDLPIKVLRRDGDSQTLQAEASLYCSLDDPNAKGLNLSRLYLLMHDTIKDHVSIDGIADTLEEMAEKQGSNHAYCKLRFKYPMIQRALRSRQPLTADDVENGHFQELTNGNKISLKKLEGHIAYRVVLEGHYHKGDENELRFFLTTEFVYSSTCPCSFELAHNATDKRAAAANAHSQRSIMKTTVEFDAADIVYIEELIELHRQNIPTEVQVVVKRRDEQAFAELNGANLLFSEDAVRIMADALDSWYDAGKISDYSVVAEHIESLHPWSAIAMVHKHNDITPR
ncbi:MAG: GTP cyclohydrolase I FolE2 [Candidatus Peribacteraceae bacterium]|nr:GTP cyclohydrolase I FolE2 [Candidatus Peribacteraceae bacterium]